MNTTVEFQVEKCLEVYSRRYENLLKMYYPAHKSAGFTERNQSVNFAAAVESVYNSAFAWYEVPMGETKQERIDAVIFVPETASTIIIEAKRFSNTNQKLRELAKDIQRIRDRQNLHTVCQGLKKEYTKCGDNAYGIVLADLWPGDTKEKGKIYESWCKESFFEDFKDKLPGLDKDIDAIANKRWFNYEHIFTSDLSRYCLLALAFKL